MQDLDWNNISQAMNRLSLLIIALLLSHSLPITAYAQPNDLIEVIESCRRYHPKILESIMQIDSARGRLRSSKGTFDPSLQIESRAYASGYYEGSNSTESKIQLPFETASSDFFLQFRSGHGNFPTYEDQYDTLDTGEFGAGVEFSLLRDLFVDNRRTKLFKAQLDLVRRQHLLDAQKLLVLRDAVDSFWSWQIALEKRAVLKNLLLVSERRQTQFDELVRLGQLAPIEALDNSRTILKRREKILEQEQKIQKLTQKLSLYWRDSNGDTFVPAVQNVESSAPKIISSKNNFTNEILSRFDSRPDILALKTRISKIEAELDLSENDLLPRLDLRTSVTRDYGNGELTREGTEWKSMLTFQVPLYRREAKGRIIELGADAKSIKQQIRLLRDDMKTLSTALSEILTQLYKRVQILEKEVTIAEKLEKAEMEKLRAGDSTLLLVALRELETANVRSRRLDALLENRRIFLNIATLVADEKLFSAA